MSDDESLSVVESLYILGFQTAPTLYRAVDEDGNTPRKILNSLKNLGTYPGLPFREIIQGQPCNLLIIHNKFAECGFADPRQFGCERQRMLPGFDHQRYQIPQTDKPELLFHAFDIT